MYCTTLTPSCFGPKISLLGYEEMKTIRSQGTLASCRWSARCSMACKSMPRKCSQCCELIFKSLLVINYYCEFYPHFMLIYHVTVYAFIFTTESKQGDLYIKIFIYVPISLFLSKACGSFLESDSVGAAISSPLYPAKYPDNQNCSWIIQAQEPCK